MPTLSEGGTGYFAAGSSLRDTGPPSPEEVLPRWLDELQASDRANGTIRRYKSAVESFLSWYECCEQRPLTFAQLSPIALVGYRNEVQWTQGRATSTVNGHLSALRDLVRLAN